MFLENPRCFPILAESKARSGVPTNLQWWEPHQKLAFNAGASPGFG